jgi:pentatricopeptide repeat domain-containing protein 1
MQSTGEGLGTSSATVAAAARGTSQPYAWLREGRYEYVRPEVTQVGRAQLEVITACRRKDAEAAVKTLLQWTETLSGQGGLPARVVEEVVRCCVNQGMAKRALVLLEDPRLAVDKQSFWLVLNGLGREGKVHAIPGLIAGMEARGLPPTTSTLQRAVDLLVESPSGSMAVPLLRALERTDAGRNYSRALLACQRRQDWKAFTDILRGMLQRDKPTRGMYPALFKAALNACLQMGDGALAQDVLRVGESMGLRTCTMQYNMALTASVRGGRPDEAGALLRRLERERGFLDVRSYTIVLDGYAKAEMPDEAVATFEALVARGLAPSLVTYSALINALGRAGRCDRALDVFNTVKELGFELNQIIYGSIIQACAKRGRWEQALELRKEMEKAGLVPNAIVETAVMHACAQGGRHVEALEILRDMVASGLSVPVMTYNAAMNACTRSDEYGTAAELYREVKAQGLAPDVVTFAGALKAFAWLGAWEEMQGVVEDMGAQQLVPDDSSCGVILLLAAKAGQFEVARAVCRAMEAVRGMSPLPLSTMAAVEAISGDLEKALVFLRMAAERGGQPLDCHLTRVIWCCRTSRQWPLAIYLDEWYGSLELQGGSGHDFGEGAAEADPPDGGIAASRDEAFIRRATLDALDADPTAFKLYGPGLFGGAKGAGHFGERCLGVRCMTPAGACLVLDLHHMSRAVARAALLYVIEGVRSGRLPADLPLTIIVGKGRYLSRTVTHYLDEEFGVAVRNDATNEGRIHVSADDLQMIVMGESSQTVQCLSN